jgi:hypothetical protein
MQTHVRRRNGANRLILLVLLSAPASSQKLDGDGQQRTTLAHVSVRIERGVRIDAGITQKSQDSIGPQIHHKPCDAGTEPTESACELIILEIP